MAKTQGPLYSLSASGAIGKAMVFFGWKGNNVVRKWLKPANPKSANQGNQRTMLAGTGRGVGEIRPDSSFAQQLIDLGLIPGGQTKQSFVVQYILNHYLMDSTTYAAELAALTGHAAYADFGAAADTLGLVEFSLDYDTIAAYNKALSLYLIAKTAIALAFTGTPYTTALASWVTADINGMLSDFTA